MKWIQVEPSPGLQGTVKIPGSKNSSLAILAAACLADEPVTLFNVPPIADYRVISQIGQDIGLRMERDAAGEVHIDPRHLIHTFIDPAKSTAFRTAYYFVGALLAKFGKVTVGYPGGDDFLERPIDQHIKALRQLGATFTFHQDRYEVEAKELVGATIYFDVITSGATINSMLAAVRAKGITVLLNAAKDPEVVDTANFLNQMGAKITGAGTDTIRIEGVPYLCGCRYSIIPDRLIAGAFLIAAGVTGGRITVQDIVPEHLHSCAAKLKEIGVRIEAHDQALTASVDGRLKPVRVRAAMYPAFPTDLQQPLTALLTQAPGKSIVADKVYPKRFNHVAQLNRLGANIELRPGVAFIKGGTPLKGNLVHATDIRAGFCLLMAGMIAEGVTTITGIEHIERGYEHAIDAFRSLGGKIRVIDAEHERQEIRLMDAT